MLIVRDLRERGGVCKGRGMNTYGWFAQVLIAKRLPPGDFVSADSGEVSVAAGSIHARA